MRNIMELAKMFVWTLGILALVWLGSILVANLGGWVL